MKLAQIHLRHYNMYKYIMELLTCQDKLIEKLEIEHWLHSHMQSMKYVCSLINDHISSSRVRLDLVKVSVSPEATHPQKKSKFTRRVLRKGAMGLATSKTLVDCSRQIRTFGFGENV